MSEIVLSVEVVDETVPSVFRIENDETIIHVDSARNAGSPKTALDNCFVAMITELVEEHGFSEREAYVQMSLNPAITARA